jgi:fatty-acyl-CoA synthase
MATPAQELTPAILESKLVEIVRELLADLEKPHLAARVAPHASFERDLGLGSLDLVELVVRVESRLDIELPDEIAEQAETPAGWAKAILQGGQETKARPQYRIVPPSREALPAPAGARTLLEVLRAQADFDPGRIHIHYVEEGAGEGVACGQLYERSLEVAAGLAARGLRRGESVAIMLPNGPDFLYAFFGAMLAGGIPVPIYPPSRPDRIEEYVHRELLVLRNAKARFLVSWGRVEALTRILRVKLPRLADAVTAGELRSTGGRAPSVEPYDVALIQYTSGSTGHPKGVMLSHANLLANVRAIGAALPVRPHDAVVSWLPLASDMGLVGCWLFSLYWGVPLTLLSPEEFFERPECWLWAVHDSRGTLSAAPNFAYEFVNRRVPVWTLEGLDLSSWRVAVNGGEPVMPATVERFNERFAPYGFRPESVVCCYGLAENAVALTAPPLGSLPRLDRISRARFERDGHAVPAGAGEDALQFYSAGVAIQGHEIRVVDHEGRPVAERVQGRLQFRGPSRMSGYFRNPRATRSVLTADGWMEAGDLAYIAGGELFVTGREKDLILRQGRAICPLDVESAAGAIPGIERDGVAVLGVPDAATGTERLVLVAETAADSEADLARLRERVAQVTVAALGFPPDQIELVPPGYLPKTENLKLRRNDARRLLVEGRLHAPPGPLWRQILRLQWRNLGPLSLIAGRRAISAVRHVAAFTLARIVSGVAGLWFRAGGGGLGAVARLLLRITGRRHALAAGSFDALPAEALVVANRNAALDPLVIAALATRAPRFSGEEALYGLPPWARFALRPFVAAAREATVLFPDGPVGATPHRSRYRLDALAAAVASGRPIVPVAIREHAHVHVGPPVECARGEDPVAVRQRVRESIARLYA